MSAPISPERRNQLLEFLRGLGLEKLDGINLRNRDLAMVDEALTHTSAELGINHEKLEFLGDAVLRLAAAEHLLSHYPTLSVGQSSALRAQLVSDRWLAEIGESCGIETVIRIGAAASGDQAARQTLRAESTEALIGALYSSWENSLEPVNHWLSLHWQRSSIALLTDPYCYNWKSALQEWSQAEGLGLPNYRSKEINRLHGDLSRFHSCVFIETKYLGEGFGGARREAEQQAARSALNSIKIEEIN
uniref:Putative ribonuclease III n=1 Tax=Paulinella chromatophora TaxID=39717 RepID=B1X4P2_PAUCH|nr:putative ribonuclease III [Paulinella chromatophora]ACB42911.1 putative ribonuclease III [Paulinella chromatophora]